MINGSSINDRKLQTIRKATDIMRETLGTAEFRRVALRNMDKG
jgi:hypothetical protein